MSNSKEGGPIDHTSDNISAGQPGAGNSGEHSAGFERRPLYIKDSHGVLVRDPEASDIITPLSNYNRNLVRLFRIRGREAKFGPVDRQNPVEPISIHRPLGTLRTGVDSESVNAPKIGRTKQKASELWALLKYSWNRKANK